MGDITPLASFREGALREHDSAVVKEVRHAASENPESPTILLGLAFPLKWVLPIDRPHRAIEWLKQGAQPSDAVKRIFDRDGIYDKVNS